MENYEYIKNGKAIPFTSVPDYDKMSMPETFKNRDPRYKQTFMYPGYIRPGENRPFVPNLYLGGYPQTKFVAQTADQMDWFRSYNDIPVMRYAEILYIYAEAKAELGILKQADLDATINVVRDRVGMPAILLASLNLNANLEKQYPNVTGSQKDVILEIRRERRIEFAFANALDMMICFDGNQGDYLKRFSKVYILTNLDYTTLQVTEFLM